MTDDLSPEIPKNSRRGRRRVWLMLGVLGGVVGALIVFLPSILETRVARSMIQTRLDARLAPGRVVIEGFNFSWSQPTGLRNLQLQDPRGHVVLESGKARLDRGLWSLITESDRSTTLVLEEAEIAITRGAKGEVDLLQAVAKLFEGDPRIKPGVRIEAPNARFRFTTPELAPIDARADIVLDFPVHGEPWTWELQLRDLGDATRRCFIEGYRGRPVPGDLNPPPFLVTLRPEGWPLAGRVGARDFSFQLNGHQNIGFDQRSGGWRTDGGLELSGIDIDDLPGLPNTMIELSYEPLLVDGTPDGPHRLSLKASTTSPLPEGIPLGGLHLEVVAEHDPATDLLVVRDGRIFSGEQVIEARGQVTALSTNSPHLEFSAASSIQGDWLDRMVSRAIGLETKLEGERIDAQLAGIVDPAARADPLSHLSLVARLSVDSAEALGLRAGAMELVARNESGRLVLAPIETTLNNGLVRVLPEVLRDDEGEWVLRLSEGSAIDGAEVNEQLSSEVLAFAVPVLERATHPTGRVSALVNRAEIPIGPGSAGRSPEVEATIVFDQVEFGPGPMAASILALIGREDATLRLDQPVVALIADRRVQTKGFAIPIGNATAFELEGSVGFDRSLDLTARLPITRRMLGNVPIVSDIFGDLAIEVPIGGELGNAKLDKLAFNEQLRGFAAELAERGASGGLKGVFNLLDRLRERRIQRRESMRPGTEDAP